MTAAEWTVIRFIRSFEFGSIEVQIQNGIPVFLTKIHEKVKLV